MEAPALARPPAPQAPDNERANNNIRIDPKIAAMCNIPNAHFAFDSAKLGAEAGVALDALATCFITGPAKDDDMRIVGHADPRGETEYNFALGQRRAGSVEAFLVDRNLPTSRVATSSRGELDAIGTDEVSWREDRRVDIFLAE